MAKALVAAAVLAMGGVLSVHPLGARQIESRLPAIVEDGHGSSLVPAVPPKDLEVSATTAVAAAEGGLVLPPWVSMTAGFYVATATRRPFWVVAFHNVTIPEAWFPNMGRCAEPCLWHTSYVLVDARTGRVESTIDGRLGGR